MKRLIAFFLVTIMLLAVMPAFSAYAATGELLKNPGFEDGEDPFYVYGATAEVAVDKKYAHKGDAGVHLSKRTSKYTTFAQDIQNILTLNGPGEYTASLWAKLPEGQTSDAKCYLVINVKETEGETKYYSSGQKVLTDKWQQFTFKGKIEFDPKVGFETALIYPQYYIDDTAPEIIIDDFSLVKNSEVNGIPLDQVERPGSTNVSNLKPNTEMLENPGFEEGEESPFYCYGPGAYSEVDEAYAHSGDYGMLIYDRAGQYSTYAQDISDMLTAYGPGEYQASVWMKLADDSKKAGNAYLVLNVKANGGTQKYYTSGQKPLTKEWQQFTFRGNIEFDAEKGFEVALIYQQSVEMPDVIVDDFSLKKLSEPNGIDPSTIKKDEYENYQMTHINVSGEKREEETTFGAIRWDAWYSHDGNPASIVSQVEKSLSPKEYHWRAPFFANITDEGKIEMPEYTQEIFDKEMEYAMEAGIDYFAYLYYDSAMGTARKMHTTSKYKNDVKMALCLDGNAIGKFNAREDIKELIKKDCYMKVLDGRPLMYYYLNTSNKKQNMILVADEIKYYRAYCTSLGLKEPFAVVMNITGSETSSIFGDAASRYSFSGTSDQTFESFINGVQRTYEGYQKAGFQYVPPTTFGWHAEPRYKNPVSWMTVKENSWVPYPTEEEMYNHISYALSYLDHPSAEMFTKANTLIFYAWNEHDEGSWLCPTLKVDADGNQLYNEDGSKMIDDSRVKILKKALDDFESGKRVEVFINGLSNFDASLNATPTPTPTDENSGTTNNNSFNPIFIIIPVGAAVIIAGAVTAVIIIKKKKSEK